MPYRLYSMQDSGNCWKPRVAMHQLGIDFEIVDTDILKGESRTPDFLAKNLNGRVPTLELPDGRFLAESNAMLVYLGEGTDLMPLDRYARAQAFQWMFFEQYSHEPYIATARFWRSIKKDTSTVEQFLPVWEQRGNDALGVMERHLADNAFFVGDTYSIADIALYAYTHVADEGGFSLEPYPNVRAWLERVAATPRFVPMSWRP